MWKSRLICLLLLVSFTAMATETVAAEDKRSARKQERLEKKQVRQEKREERKEEKAAQKEAKAQSGKTEQQEMELQAAEDTYQTPAPVVEEELVEVYGEELEEDVTPTSSDGVKPVKVMQLNDTPKVVDDSLKESADDSSEGASSIALFLVIVVVCTVSFFSWLFSRRCPKCKKLFGMRVADEAFMGYSKMKREKDSHGEYSDVFYSNIKVTRKCRHCGYVAYHIVERKGTKE